MLEIRQATKADVSAICSFNHIGQQGHNRKRFITDAVCAGRCSLAIVEGQVVGYVVLEYTFYGCGFISLLCVHSNFRRRRVGSELIKHAETICQTEKLFISTNQSNIPMQSLLGKLAYARSGVIENLDEGDPELVYFKRLAEPT